MCTGNKCVEQKHSRNHSTCDVPTARKTFSSVRNAGLCTVENIFGTGAFYSSYVYREQIRVQIALSVEVDSVFIRCERVSPSVFGKETFQGIWKIEAQKFLKVRFSVQSSNVGVLGEFARLARGPPVYYQAKNVFHSNIATYFEAWGKNRAVRDSPLVPKGNKNLAGNGLRGTAVYCNPPARKGQTSRQQKRKTSTNIARTYIWRTKCPQVTEARRSI